MDLSTLYRMKHSYKLESQVLVQFLWFKQKLVILNPKVHFHIQFVLWSFVILMPSCETRFCLVVYTRTWWAWGEGWTWPGWMTTNRSNEAPLSPPDPQDPTRGRDKVELVNTSLLRRLLSGPWHCQQFSVSQAKPDQTCYCWFEEENMFAQIF